MELIRLQSDGDAGHDCDVMDHLALVRMRWRRPADLVVGFVSPRRVVPAMNNAGSTETASVWMKHLIPTELVRMKPSLDEVWPRLGQIL